MLKKVFISILLLGFSFSLFALNLKGDVTPDTLVLEQTILSEEAFEDMYEDFNTDVIHPSKTDFSNKKDTTFIILDSFYCPFMGLVSSGFGPRKYRYHYGVDIRLDYGDTIYAAFDGRVRISKLNRTYGNLVVIRHYNGLETYYSHGSKLLVNAEDSVKAGDPIALGGATGRAYGNHLHFEVRYLGTAINPETIIDFAIGKLKSDTLQLCQTSFQYMVDVKKMQANKYHVVKSGDTLYQIARRYGTSVPKLCKLNGLKSSSTLRVKQKIRVR